MLLTNLFHGYVVLVWVPQVRTVLVAALSRGLKVNTLTATVGSHSPLLLDVFSHAADDVLLCKWLLNAGHPIIPVMVSQQDAALLIADSNGNNSSSSSSSSSSKASSTWRPGSGSGAGTGTKPDFYGLSQLHVGASYLERTITGVCVCVCGNPMPIFQWQTQCFRAWLVHTCFIV